MEITGQNIIGAELSKEGSALVKAVNPKTQETLPEPFYVASQDQIDSAIRKATEAYKVYKNTSGQERARFLRAIADEIMNLGDTLLHRAMAESGLPEARFIGERGRTVGQLRLFADVAEKGEWVQACIDDAIPDRTPPKPDIRKMKIAIGPVVVFTASNFPLAYSTAGGDTASALAAGNPVIVKAHESHLGTNELVAKAVQKAAVTCGLPDGVFSSLVGQGFDLGQQLVKHPAIKAVGFTGSQKGGIALHKLAQQREEPIPVFAEMGSINPVVLLPGAIDANEKLPNILAGSVTLGVGQFCTNPGLMISMKSPRLEALKDALQAEFSKAGSFTMLNEGIFKSYEAGKKQASEQDGVSVECSVEGDNGSWTAKPAFVSVAASRFIQNPQLHKEVFGPFTLLVECDDEADLLKVVGSIEGQLTGSIYGTDEELAANPELISSLRERVGRMIFNGVPTGVEVCASMNHGGPFPATTDNRFTAVGHHAIDRFSRPISYQDCPKQLLPEALRDGNPLNIHRTVNGVLGMH